jgi:hypothetical protein
MQFPDRWLAVLTLTLVAMVGCTPTADTVDTAPTDVPTETPASHAHPSHGPHDGDLIELGDEEWHAELVHSENTVTVYILDASATKAVSIDASEVRINLTHDDEPKQYVLTASPQADDSAGQSSRFLLDSSALVHALEHDDANARLTVTISGRQYNGRIEHAHEHDHEDSEHSH